MSSATTRGQTLLTIKNLVGLLVYLQNVNLVKLIFMDKHVLVRLNYSSPFAFLILITKIKMLL